MIDHIETNGAYRSERTHDWKNEFDVLRGMEERMLDEHTDGRKKEGRERQYRYYTLMTLRITFPPAPRRLTRGFVDIWMIDFIHETD